MIDFLVVMIMLVIGVWVMVSGFIVVIAYAWFVVLFAMLVYEILKIFGTAKK